MLFDSIDFAIFFPVVLILYWLVPWGSLRRQNTMLLVASYYFYACWDVRFLLLLVLSTAVGFVTGALVHSAPDAARKRFWLVLSVVVNLGVLGTFKYYDFFASGFADLVSVFGCEAHPVLLNLVLPVGISFYTFHGLSYVFDVGGGRIAPVRSIVDHALFVGFFPLLVAGPIERATHLLPQLQRPRSFLREQAVSGLRQMLWGFFKKIVIADNCAALVDPIFADPAAQSGSTLILGSALFAIQIYGDFSGYSDIALGTARLLGIELLQNFSFPYFSRDIAEFWRRWHISLTSWFRDYLYIPLGGSRGGVALKVRNTFIIFLVSGFWHGAAWTFLAWGALNAIYFLPLLLTGRNRAHLGVVADGRLFPTLRETVDMLLTFVLVCVAWVFFRADDLSTAMVYFNGVLDASLFTAPTLGKSTTLVLVAFFMSVEWSGRGSRFALEALGVGWPRALRWAFYALLVFACGFFMRPEEVPFIYFQF